jgi:hypothetical protein
MTYIGRDKDNMREVKKRKGERNERQLKIQ